MSLRCCVLLLEYFIQIFRPHDHSQNLNQLFVAPVFRNMKRLLTVFLGIKSGQPTSWPGWVLVTGRKQLSSESGLRAQPRGAKIWPGQVACSHLSVHLFLLPHEVLWLVLLQKKKLSLSSPQTLRSVQDCRRRHWRRLSQTVAEEANVLH